MPSKQIISSFRYAPQPKKNCWMHDRKGLEMQVKTNKRLINVGNEKVFTKENVLSWKRTTNSYKFSNIFLSAARSPNFRFASHTHILGCTFSPQAATCSFLTFFIAYYGGDSFGHIIFLHVKGYFYKFVF